MSTPPQFQQDAPRSRITDPRVILSMVAEYPHWYHQIELLPGLVTPGVNASKQNLGELEALGFPKDWSGLRVLDIGCSDGFFSFEVEKRGAREVVGIDYRQPTTSGFAIASTILGSRVEHLVENVYDLSPERHGVFDAVLFLGVLYHLRNPLLALDRIRSVIKTGGLLFVETHLMDNFVLQPDGSVTTLAKLSPALAELPLWQFYARDDLNKDATNKWSPNMTGLKQVIEAAEFQVITSHILGSRGYATAKATEDRAIEHFRQVDSGKGL